MTDWRLTFPPETETYLLEALAEFGIDIADRKRHLAERATHYQNHPVLSKFTNSELLRGIFGPPPSDIVDPTLWNFIQSYFDGAFQLFNKPTVIVPIPLYKKHAEIIKDDNINYNFIFINEFNILLSEGLGNNFRATIDYIYQDIKSVECNVPFASVENAKHLYFKDDFLDISGDAKNLVFNMIFECMETAINASLLADEHKLKASVDVSDVLLSYLQNVIACGKFIENSNPETKFKNIYTCSYPTTYNSEYSTECAMKLFKNIEDFMVGYLFRIIAHEIVHRDSSHLSDAPKLSIVDNANDDEIFDALIEIEADLWISRAWHTFIENSMLDAKDIYPYVGMLWANLADYIWAITTLTCERESCLSGYEEWLCRLLVRDHALIPDNLISSYPTELERMEASMFNPVNMACITLPHDKVCEIAKIISITFATFINNDFYILRNIKNKKFPNYFGCEDCNNDNPFIPFNMLKDRLSRYNDLDAMQQEALKNTFENRQSPLSDPIKLSGISIPQKYINRLDKKVKKHV